MGEFDRAVREMLRARLVCPRCHAENLPGRSPEITVIERGQAECSSCSKHWTIPSYDLSKT